MKYLLGYTPTPSLACAQKLSKLLVRSGCAACVNILPHTQSMYRWQKKIEKQKEWILLYKTTTARWNELEILIKQHHPYTCPCIVAIEIAKGSKEYLQWIAESCFVRSGERKRVRKARK